MHKAAHPNLGDSSVSSGQVQATREPTLTEKTNKQKP